jgi:hypothetical protein
MKSHLKNVLMAGLLASYSLQPNMVLAAEGVKSFCDSLTISSKLPLVAKFETLTKNNTTLCAAILKTDDSKMFELVISQKTASGEEEMFGDMNGDDERIYILENPDSNKKHKAYTGITCNSSQGCQTGVTFIANLDSDMQTLSLM